MTETVRPRSAIDRALVALWATTTAMSMVLMVVGLAAIPSALDHRADQGEGIGFVLVFAAEVLAIVVGAAALAFGVVLRHRGSAPRVCGRVDVGVAGALVAGLFISGISYDVK